MFGLFKKKESAPVKKNPAKVSMRKTEGEASTMTAGEVLSAINAMQKELDRLKLAVTGGMEHDVSGAGRVTEHVLDELRRDGVEAQKSDSERIVEGVFDGYRMIGADGQPYDVPANYASKSKLVEGDILKLTINNRGAFLYKQIKPIERDRKVGVLEQDPQNLQYYAVAEGKKWKLLTASVTYYKGETGDEVIFLVPQDGMSRWAAVDNIINQ